MKDRLYVICCDIIQLTHEMRNKRKNQLVHNNILFMINDIKNIQLYYEYVDLMDKKLAFLSPADAYHFGRSADQLDVKTLCRNFINQVFLKKENKELIDKRDSLYQSLLKQVPKCKNLFEQFNDIYNECELDIINKINECIHIGLREREFIMNRIGIIRAFDSLGRISIPKDYRNIYNLSEKAEVEIFIDNGCILLKPVSKSCFVCGKENGLLSCKAKHICKSCYKEIVKVNK